MLLKCPTKRAKTQSKETGVGHTEDKRLTVHIAFSLPEAIARGRV